MDQTDIVIEICGVGMAREELLHTKINQHPEFAEWFGKNFNIIKVVPTLREMCSPLGCIYGEWKKDLLDIKISKRDIGKSIFQLIRTKKEIKCQQMMMK